MKQKQERKGKNQDKNETVRNVCAQDETKTKQMNEKEGEQLTQFSMIVAIAAL